VVAMNVSIHKPLTRRRCDTYLLFVLLRQSELWGACIYDCFVELVIVVSASNSEIRESARAAKTMLTMLVSMQSMASNVPLKCSLKATTGSFRHLRGVTM